MSSLGGVFDGYMFSDMIDTIKVGETGGCFILSESGVTIANRKRDLVEKQFNALEAAQSDKSLAGMAAVMKDILKSEATEIRFYSVMGMQYIVSAAVMQTTGWNVVIESPVNEFLDTIKVLRIGIIIAALVILLTALVIIFLFSRKLVKPI